MTYSSSLSSGSIVKVELRFEFGAQELSNDVFESIVRRRENRLWYMANQTDGTFRCPIIILFLDFTTTSPVEKHAVQCVAACVAS